MTTYLIAHGAYAYPEKNWFPWLKTRLAPAPVHVPQFPTPDGHDLVSWLNVANSTLSDCPPEDTVLIGHSTGSLLVLRMAERTTKPYKAVFPICPFACDLGLPQFDPLNSSFIRPAFNWQAVTRGAKKIICFAGDNDPYVPLQYTKDVASAIGSELVVIPNGGHLNQDAGMKEFPLLLSYLEKI